MDQGLPRVGRLGVPVVPARVIECLETAVVADLADVRRSTLDYWVRTGLVQPSLRDMPGRRRTRIWTIEDAIVVRTVAELRHSGCPLQQIRKACKEVKALKGKLGADTTLAWDGSDILKVGAEGEVESVLRYPGQQVFRPVALPLGLWQGETTKAVQYIRRDLLPTGNPQPSRELALKARRNGGTGGVGAARKGA